LNLIPTQPGTGNEIQRPVAFALSVIISEDDCCHDDTLIRSGEQLVHRASRVKHIRHRSSLDRIERVPARLLATPVCLSTLTPDRDDLPTHPTNLTRPCPELHRLNWVELTFDDASRNSL